MKRFLLAALVLAVEYISDRMEEVARRFRAEYSIKAPAEGPPGAPAEKYYEYDANVFVREMDVFYRRPGNADVPLKNVLVKVCIPGKEKDKDNPERR
jgi:hypothetical protein